jgi:enamine deaminase RidA (YjgF/YER057c/UK114 family)
MSLLINKPRAVSSLDAGANTGAQISLTLRPLPGEGMEAVCRRLAATLREREATPLHLLVFGDRRARAATNEAFRHYLGLADWPVTWVEGAACDGSPLAGLQVHAFTGDVERLERNGRMLGSVFTDGGARQCLLGGLTPANSTLSRPGQTRQTLEQLQALLVSAGFNLGDLVRTWFFLEDILSWYDAFNQTRTQFYSGVPFRTGSPPASTGVGAGNPAGTALALAAWAYRPLADNARAEAVASPRQCPAPAYGSVFSRAMELASDAGRRLFISGTASIAPGGKTLWPGEVRRQVDQTMEVVGAILQSRGFTPALITRATAYFRRPGEARVFTEWLAANRWADLPVVVAHCDICREDLLFELEAEAERR